MDEQPLVIRYGQMLGSTALNQSYFIEMILEEEAAATHVTLQQEVLYLE